MVDPESVIKRDRVAREILSTERTFVESLEAVVDVYVTPLRERCKGKDTVLKPQQITDIFAGIEEILGVNKMFLTDLEERFDNWDMSLHRVGDLFIKYAPFFKMYTKYCNNQFTCMATLDQAEKSSSFKAFCDNALMDPRCKAQPLRSFLIMPVQRIPRYALLLKELSKEKLTPPDHADANGIQQALTLVEEVAATVNEAIRQSEQSMKTLEIQQTFIGSVPLVEPGRVLVKEGALLKRCRRSDKKFYFFLFNDCLVTSEKLPTKKYMLHRILRLDQCKCEPVDDGIPEKVRKVQQLPDPVNFTVASTEKSFEVIAESLAERDEWVTAIQEGIEVAKQKRATLRTSTGGEEEYIAPVWQQNKDVTNCSTCQSTFSLVNRRHHCRQCGQVVCGSCSTHRAALAGGDDRQVRVCDPCYFNESGDVENLLPSQNAGKLQTLQDAFGGKVTLVESDKDRLFIKGGPLSKVCRKAMKKFHFFLFSDQLIYGDKSGNKYNFHRSIPLLGSRVDDVTDPNRDFGFQVISPAKSFIVCAENQESKVNWMLNINNAIDAHQKASGQSAPAAPVAPVWVSDAESKNCMLCSRKFTLTTRRHHCRLCGKLVCGSCSNAKVKLAHVDKVVRACNNCVASASDAAITLDESKSRRTTVDVSSNVQAESKASNGGGNDVAGDGSAEGEAPLVFAIDGSLPPPPSSDPLPPQRHSAKIRQLNLPPPNESPDTNPTPPVPTSTQSEPASSTSSAQTPEQQEAERKAAFQAAKAAAAAGLAAAAAAQKSKGRPQPPPKPSKNGGVTSPILSPVVSPRGKSGKPQPPPKPGQFGTT